MSAPQLTRTSRNQARGFTLLELMLALVIMALVLTMVYSAFSAGSRACRFGGERAQIFHTARMAMQDILQSIENIDFGTNDGYRFLGESSSAGAGRAGSVPADTLEFAAFSAPRLAGDRWYAGQSRVRYVITRDAQDEEGAPLKHVLEKWTTDLDDVDFKSAHVTELSRDVAGIRFTYFGGENDKESDEWDSDRDDQLPDMVQVTLYVYEAQGERVHPLRSAAMIPTMKATLAAELKGGTGGTGGASPTATPGKPTPRPGQKLTPLDRSTVPGAHGEKEPPGDTE